MSSPHDMESDLAALDDFLMSDQSPEDCMMLCDLDGFLTGVAIGPELIPPSEWLPAIWREGEGPVFDDTAQAQSILGAIMNRHNDILDRASEGVIEPIFMESIEGHVIASDWAEGFIQAIRLRAEAWDGIFKSDEHAQLMIPILAICCDEQGKSLVPVSREAEDKFFEDAGELIPECVRQIAEFWRAARSAPRRRPTGPKAGRGNPVPVSPAGSSRRAAAWSTKIGRLLLSETVEDPK